MRITLQLLFLFLSMAVVLACDEGDMYCDDLEALVADPKTGAFLLSWVESNIEGTIFKRRDVWPGGAGPGSELRNVEIDWSILNFGAEARIHLVGDDFNDIQSVFFGERTGQGILVRTSSGKSFGVNHSSLRIQSEMIAVICDKRG